MTKWDTISSSSLIKALGILAMFLTVQGFAQEFSSDYWHRGFMVTTEGDTLHGSIKYDMEANLVTIDTRTTIRAYSSHKVFYFEIFDEVYKNYREFYTLPYRYKGDYSAPVIFELLYEGGLSLLSREKVVQEVANSGSFYLPGSAYRQNAMNYDFYYLDKKGNMTPFNGSKGDLLQIMHRKRTEVKEFIRKNRLKTDEIQDLVRITSFYNSI